MNAKPLIGAFFAENSLVSHHISSYNDLIDHGLQNVINEIGSIKPELEGFEIKLGKITVKDPIVKEADGSTRRIYPHEARLRDRTYAAPLTLEMIPIESGEEQEALTVAIGKLPIMLKSKKCLLAGLSDEELIRVGEDRVFPRRYGR